jgi:hypothetical protein
MQRNFGIVPFSSEKKCMELKTVFGGGGCPSGHLLANTEILGPTDGPSSIPAVQMSQMSVVGRPFRRLLGEGRPRVSN